MCGIVGVVAKNPKGIIGVDQDIFKNMLICDAVRGVDSTGAFFVDGDSNAHYTKIAAPPFHLLRSHDFENNMQMAFREGRAMIGHNRKATEGSVSNDNAHPFAVGPVVLVHNGHISNYRSMVHHKVREKNGIVVDSHAAAYLMATDEPHKVIPELNGAYAFVWYNAKDKRLYMIRNEQRPLFFTMTDNKFFFASEGMMLEWILMRNSVEYREHPTQIQMLKPNVLQSINLDNEKFSFFLREIKQKPVFQSLPPVQHNPVQEQRRNSHTRRERAFGAPFKKVELDRPNVDNPNPIEYASTPVMEKFREQAIPKDKQWNIHYGHDMYIFNLPKEEFQQIVWEPADYKYIGANKVTQKKLWKVWGNALQSRMIEVTAFIETNDEKDIEKIAYADALLSLVIHVRKTPSPEGDQSEVNPFFEVYVNCTRPCKLVQLNAYTYLTDEHLDHLRNEGACECGVNIKDNGDTEECKISYDYMDTTGNNIIWQCSWCAQANAKLTANGTDTQ